MRRSRSSQRTGGGRSRPPSGRSSRVAFPRRTCTSTCARARARRRSSCPSSRRARSSCDQLEGLRSDPGKVWVKRGDVHAERPEDVIATSLEHVDDALHAFRQRGIPWVALQQHIPGPVVKFYGVADGRFFNWYGADAGFAGERPRVDEQRLKALAADGAPSIGLEV